MMRRVLQLMLASAALAALIALSSWRTAEPASSAALLRLSWRALGREVEQCRALSAEEIAKQPVHMRRTEVCERGVEPYRLEVTVDGVLRLDSVFQSAGVRGDRPLYVLRDFALAPGWHELDIRFYELETAHVTPEQRTHFPDALSFASRVQFPSRRIVLITYDAEQRELVLKQ